MSEGAAQIVQAARGAGKPVVVDAEAPVAPARDVLAQASHVVFSAQGLNDLCGGSDAAALARAVAQLGTWCAVTRGAAPVLCHDGQNLIEVPTYATRAVNTLGAGDVWHAAFTLALAKGCAEFDAVRWANAAAALTVRRSIRDDSFPSPTEIAELSGFSI